ncbi:uncharacterized protein LOC129755121 [Uranotaenia lowii]|uniref:uncharacterized protein LOC129755121 n=1 Tax=Uranotaenia lowii TaxID=190385 RepID=UPI00247A3067|nr:uncharacterized protein LOC129755121 [Uranotaenia lowii]
MAKFPFQFDINVIGLKCYRSYDAALPVGFYGCVWSGALLVDLGMRAERCNNIGEVMRLLRDEEITYCRRTATHHYGRSCASSHRIGFLLNILRNTSLVLSCCILQPYYERPTISYRSSSSCCEASGQQT